jgi:hypothetical protein
LTDGARPGAGGGASKCALASLPAGRRRYTRSDDAKLRVRPSRLAGALRGERVNDLEQCIPSTVTKVRYEVADRNGVPEVVSWLDSNGQIVFRWIDSNRDARADRIGLYQNGMLVVESRP